MVILLWIILIVILVKVLLNPKLDITDTQTILWFDDLAGNRTYIILWRQ